VGAFSAKFSTTPSGKTMDGTQKVCIGEMMARTTSIIVQNLVEIERRTSAWEDEMWCFSLCGSVCRRQLLCRYCFYSRASFGVFRHAGATHCTDQCEIWQGAVRSAPPRQLSPWSAQWWGFTAPKTEKMEFYQYNCPKGRVPCTIFTKFTAFNRVLSLHNVTKFGCFISINDKIIKNLLRWGRYQPNFRRPLAAKLWMGPQKV